MPEPTERAAFQRYLDQQWERFKERTLDWWNWSWMIDRSNGRMLYFRKEMQSRVERMAKAGMSFQDIAVAVKGDYD